MEGGLSLSSPTGPGDRQQGAGHPGFQGSRAWDLPGEGKTVTSRSGGPQAEAPVRAVKNGEGGRSCHSQKPRQSSENPAYELGMGTPPPSRHMTRTMAFTPHL